ncbi:MAG: hypothetical protein WCL28_08410, partial [bacterium]
MTGLGLGSICIIYKRLRPSQWRRFICFVMFLTLLPALMSCEMAQNKIQASRSGSEVTSISKITPIAAKPNDVVSLTGINFYEAKNLKVSLELANGERATVPLAITDTKTASFTMPDGVGLGVKDVTLTQGTAQLEVLKFNLIADQADNQLPIVVGDGSTVCSDQQYIDRNGDKKTGTKNCSSGEAPPACSENGSVGCVTTETYKAADLTNLSASSIKSGVTIAGVTGTVTQSPDNCSSNGQQSCVATGTYFAGTNCAADGSNCFLPAYSVPGMQTKKAIDFATIDSSKMLDTLTVSGVTGTVASRGTWNLTQTFPGIGYYSGVSSSPAATTIASGTTITGVAGSASLRPADCSTDGGVGCVVVGPSFAAAATSGAESKILSGQSVAGVSGNVTIPAVGKVLTSTQYGVSGTGNTGTLTLPSAANVLSGTGTYGDPNALMTPALADRGTWNLTNSFPGAGYYSGTTNAPTDATIATGTTITGVAGSATLSPANCSANGQQSCVATGSYFSGTACSVDGSNCFLPAYSVPGLQTKKAIDFATIDSSKMLDSLTVSGITGAVASRGAWNLTLAFPGAGFYTGTTSAPTAATIASGTTITGVLGSATLSPANCSADGATGCVAVATYPAALATGAASKILFGQTLAGVAGNVTLPAAGKVLTGNTYGVSGTGSTGTLTYPAAGDVLSTAPAYGDPGSQLTPSLANRGVWDLETAFPGQGYYSNVTKVPGDTSIASGASIVGVVGTAVLKPADCSTNAVTGCVTTSTYKSADLTNLSAGNIKSGVTIAGTAGQYPSSSFQLTGSSGSDLTTPTFNAQIKSSATFQYFGSDGARYTGTGDTDITAANIASGVDIFGATGSLTGAVA